MTSAGGPVTHPPDANPSLSELQEEQGAAAALALAAAAAAAARSPGSVPSTRSSPWSGQNKESGGDEELTDEVGAHDAMPQRRSGSLSTLDRSDWRAAGGGGASDEQLLQQQLSQQQAGVLQQHQSQQQHQAQQNGYDVSQPQQRGRRNPRQQEQNKQAQQRYRAKRKAQFEELQRKVQHLSKEVAESQRHRQENEKLRSEMAQLRAMLTTAAAAGGPTAAAAVAAAAAAASTPGSAAPVAQPAAPPGLAQFQMGKVPQMAGTAQRPPPPFPSQSSSLLGSGGSGAFKPTAMARALAPATLAELPAPAAPSAVPTAPAMPAAAPAALAGPLPAKQVHAALNLYYRNLQAFAASVQLERVPPDGSGLGAEAAMKLAQLVRTGIELVKMVLQAGGPDSASLITAGMPGVGADGVSPADSLQQWRMVAARVALTPEQCLLLADWRRRFLQKMDECYGRRVLHKAQLSQLPPSNGQAQWVEALLLQAAETVGFSACALACAQLEGVVSALGESLREERCAACAMMAELLDSILTKVQAARFLLAGHPFCWNGLSFAHAVASLPAAEQPVALKQEPLSELLGLQR